MKTNGLVAGEAVNTPSEKPVRTRSRFPSLSYHLYNTERFGEYNSCFVFDAVEGDRVPVLSGGRVSSYTLKAPLMQSIFKKKDFFMVPMEAILPKNWQKFYTNPTVGDDVPDDCGTSVFNFWSRAYYMFTLSMDACYTIMNTTPGDSVDILNAVFRNIVIGEYFYSSGSLIKTLGASGFRFCRFRYNGKSYSFDSWFDEVIGVILSRVPWFEFIHDGSSYVCVIDESTNGYRIDSSPVVPFRAFLQMLRDDLTTYISSVDAASTPSVLLAGLGPLYNNSTWSRQVASGDVSYDLRRLWAYQIVCAHFYTNDNIDYVYSADILRNLVDYLVFTQSDGTVNVPTFAWNGVNLQYDSMSGRSFRRLASVFYQTPSDFLLVRNGSTTQDQLYRNYLGYFSLLFSYRRSLRYVDYFTGSRSRPLAVGDVNVNVNSNLVNIVDVTRNIQRQRFFNAVNRFGRRFEEYIKGLSGVVPDTDYHNPLYLAHTSDTVYGVETENTGVAQQTQGNSVTSRFQTNGSRYSFEFEVDRPCVIIGISYYDMPRAYLFATERQLFHQNRFDMFNPFMQFIGDQEVSQLELGQLPVIASNGTFGYQLRHMEYKQRFDEAAGAFLDDLPGYLFTERVFGGMSSVVQSPHFIRSLNAELDSFYVALTGYSNGHYFHFIVDNDNRCDASRPMAFAPSIL